VEGLQDALVLIRAGVDLVPKGRRFPNAVLPAFLHSSEGAGPTHHSHQRAQHSDCWHQALDRA
jgi:hypothetical protein